MDAVPILVAVGGILVGIGLLALLRRERARVRTEARERARRDDEFRRELAAAEDARRSADLVLSSMEDGVLLFGPDGGTRLANPAVEAQLGVRPASIESLLPLGLRHLAERAATNRAVLAVEVAEGDAVTAGQVLAVIEAMKMENEVHAPRDGIVSGLSVRPGEPIGTGQVICAIEPATEQDDGT